MTTENTAPESIQQDHIGVVAEMINHCLDSDGWDVGVIEEIAGYCKNLGLAIWDVEDCDFTDDEVEWGKTRAQSLDVEAESFPIFTEEMLAAARERSSDYTQRFIDAFDDQEQTTFKWNIEVHVGNASANEVLTETLAACLPHLYDTTFTCRMTPVSNTFSYDNEPF